MISKILVATDGSDLSQRSIEFAAGLARQTGSSLTLLTVIEKGVLLPVSVPDPATPALPEATDDYLRQAAEALLSDAEELCSGISVEKLIRSGDPVEEIIMEAEHSGADLIVVGSHGKSALKAALIGSVTFGLIHKDTRFPVLVVRRQPEI
jgi:nucleotide-binding universal stress UspA family protein